MKRWLTTLWLLLVFSQATEAVGNLVVDDLVDLEKNGFSLKKENFRSTKKTLSLTIKIPADYDFGEMGEKPFVQATLFKPENQNLEGPKLILPKGMSLPLVCSREGEGFSLTFSVLMDEIEGVYLEVMFNEGSGHSPMLVQIPLKLIVDKLERRDGTNQAK